MRTANVWTSMLLIVAPLLASADRVDDYVNREMAKWHVPGLSLAVIQKGKIVRIKGYGLANLETNTPASADTVYKIGSISKQFIAAGIMMLVEDGKLRVDDPIRKYLDGVPDSWSTMTIRHLLTHTSGLVEDPPTFDPYKPQPDAELVKAAYANPLLFKPGENISYSNLGYFALAEVIHKVTGSAWSDFIQSRLFRPTGMTSTRTTTTTDMVPGRAAGYTMDGSRLANAENWISVRPSGAFISTVRDMAMWDLALDGDAILKSKTREEMWTPVTLSNGKSIPYGFGWGLSPLRGHRRVMHNGNLPGFQSDFERFVDDRLSVVVLTNTQNADPSIIARGVASLYIPGLALKPIPDHDPAITASVSKLVDGLISKNLDTAALTPKLAAYLPGDPLSRWSKMLSDPGSLKSIRLVDQGVDGDLRVFGYRLTYAGDSVIFRCKVTADGKIDDFGIEPE